MSYRVLKCATSYGLIFALAAIARGADSWPTFRGPQRTAVSPDKGLLTEWPEGGPKLVWKTAGAGRGYSSLAIVDGRIYTLGDAPSTADDKDEYLLCFNQADGKQLWKTKTGPAYHEGQPNWQSSRSTPTVDGDRLYVITPLGVLICCKTSGEELWRHDLPKDFAGKKADQWGYSESVLIDGDQARLHARRSDQYDGRARQVNRRKALVKLATRRPWRRPFVDRNLQHRRHARVRAIDRQRRDGRACERRQTAVDFRHRQNHRRHSHPRSSETTWCSTLPATAAAEHC